MITTELIDKLIELIQYNNLSLATIEKTSDRSRRNLLNDVNQINNLLSEYNINILITNDEILKVTEFDLNNLINDIFSDDRFLFQKERPYMIILYLFLKQDFVSVNYLQELLKMSKNSVLTDINDAHNISQENRIEINYTRKNGYVLEGNELMMRKLISDTVTTLLSLSTGEWIIKYVAQTWNISLKVSEISNLLIERDDISFVNERLEDVVYLISILEAGPIIKDQKLDLKQAEAEYIKKSEVYGLSNQMIKKYPRLNSQKSYITVQLLSVIQGNIETDENKYFQNILEEIIINVQGYVGGIFPNTEKFRENLYNHLIPSYFRMRFQIQLKNPLKKKILSDYPNLFFLIKRSLEPLSEQLNFEVTDDEIAYFVMHFGTYFQTQIDSKSPELNAVILCPHGMGTSILLENLFNNVMPEINFIKYSSEDSKEIESPHIDMIISTVYYESEKPVYIVNPSMNHLEISLLKRTIYEKFGIQTKTLSTVNELYKKIDYLTETKDPLMVKSEMDRVLDDNLRNDYKKIKNYEFSPLLTEKMIIQRNKVSNWKKAINLASKPLLDFGYIDENYIEAMIDTVEKYGPYIVLAPKVAIPHAKPIDGSNKLGISLLQVKQDVNFKNNTDGSKVPANLFFVISIHDNYSHLSILKRINSIIENKEVVSSLIEAESKKEILKIISEHDIIN